MNVTDDIRATVKQVLHDKRMTQNELAERLGVTPQALSRTLNERGKIPGLWKGIFEELGLKLVAINDDPQN